ncbi:hypothetical protein [Fructobacillus americanaquae]|uniref:Uncharacterized protein n=1 Tax=Fructobacillus americanaquae TaxID=2940302 RepID=A0ABY5C356_9LACO|nr:hypothetical protein [Fructobacillus americanaquae]USS92043.1 hypothetical protein M3M36_00025 [Fructobacillus americanaquae]
MNFLNVINQFKQLKGSYDELMNGLVGIGLVEEFPEISFNDSYSRYDVNDYRQIYNDLNLSRSCVNWLITLTNKNGFADNDGNDLQPVDFTIIDLIDGQEMSGYYTSKLKEMQTLLDQLKAILVENNVLAK